MQLRNKCLVLLGAFLFISLLFTSCNIQEEGSVPAYLSIEQFSIVNDPGSDNLCFDAGAAQFEVLINGSTIGVYSINTRFPVYELGEKAMTIIPLVRQNGSSSQFMAHPFWSPIEQTLTIEAGGYYPLNLSTSYIQDVQFYLIDGFEGGGFIFNEDLDGDTIGNFNYQYDGSCGENGIAYAGLNEEHLLSEVATDNNTRYSLVPNSDVIVQFDYNSDIPFQVGFLAYEGQFVQSYYDLVLLETENEWKTIFYRADVLLTNLGAEEYRLIIRAQIPEDSNGNLLDTAAVRIDNLKLLSL